MPGPFGSRQRVDEIVDLPDDVLKELDIVVCSIHHRFHLPREQQTERILRAMDNRYMQILAHPTGRLLGRRSPYEVDLERVILGAKERGCAIEINAWPNRLDLDDVHAKFAREAGVPLVIATDSHKTTELDFMRYGIAQARRGWLERNNVLNARDLAELRQLLSLDR